MEINIPGAPEGRAAFNDLTAAQITAGIKIGWNLGNTMDATGLTWLGANPPVSEMERAWGNPVTSAANFAALKEAGFNAVRIPVSWNKALSGDYVIREDWLQRVIQIVNYAIDLDMYVIINTHHDEDIFKFTNAETDASLDVFQKVWEQIASVFRNYSEKLIFEALNEPRTKGSAQEWSGGTAAEHINLNRHYERFIKVVRSSGGNNVRRVLMINTYAASAEQTAMNGLVLPEDTVPGKLIVSIHCYTPYDFALNARSPVNSWDINKYSDTNPITGFITRAYNAFTAKGIPVILGEFGAMNKDNEETRAQWAEFYVKTAMEMGMPCIWWDNGAFTGGADVEKFGLLDRRNNTFAYPLVVEGLMRGVSGWSGR
jgi:endoglucanase